MLVKYFPKIPTYHRFIELIPRQTIKLYVFLKVLTFMSKRTGIYFIDSKKLPVCENRRMHSNKVFEGFAKQGLYSTLVLLKIPLLFPLFNRQLNEGNSIRNQWNDNFVPPVSLVS